ncbi:MAG: phage antirepressor [Clostridia bacterium]|nr:phage antirepressor [Clostridia bacterium]
MNNELTVFTSEEFGSVRTVVRNGEPWFVAADVCKALEVANPTDSIKRLDDDEKARLNLGLKGGDTNIINEPGLYSLVLGSRKPQAKAFKRWITHDVIPSIRKHGMYATDETIDAMLADPDFGIRLLTELKEERRKNKMLLEENAAQQKTIEVMQPKVSYYDSILASESLIQTTLIAKDYGMSAVKFNALLKSLGVQYRMCGTWLPYQKYAAEGYMQSRTVDLQDGRTAMMMCWTQKGRLFLYNLLKEHGVLPLCEKEGAA